MVGSPIYIGVATTVVPKERPTVKGTGKRPAMQYVRMAEAALHDGAVVYLFHPHAEWSNGKIDAWVPAVPEAPRQGWVKRKMPLPDVVYENVFVHLAIMGYTSKLRSEAMRRHIPLFNPVLPGKWRMVQMLKSAGLSSYSPETERLHDVGQVQNRLRDWKIAYIKPIGGYGGMDVSRVEYVGPARYRVSVDRTQTQTGRIRIHMNGDELKRWVDKRRKRPHLLQRGLRLMTVGGRKLDFRVVVHRDIHGKWQLIGIVPKMAASDGVVTNIIAGGERLDIEGLMQRARDEQKRIPTDILEARAKEIAAVVSRRYPNAGLIGFDMAVEEDGRVSMIEMNPKPARSLLSIAMRERLAKHTVGFAIYLARRPRLDHMRLTSFPVDEEGLQ